MKYSNLPLMALLGFMLAHHAPVASAAIICTTDGINLVTFDSAAPAFTTTVAITGMGAGRVVAGMDYRGSDRKLYAMVADSVITDPSGIGVYILFMIDPVSAVATQIGTNTGSPYSSADDPLGFTFEGGDTLRVVQPQLSTNITINPDTGNTTAIGMPFNTPAGSLNAGADYSSAFSVIDSARGMVTTLVGVPGLPANNGLSMGLGTNLDSRIGYDQGFASITVGGVSQLFTVNVANGQVGNLGRIGDGSVPYGSLAVVPEPSAVALLGACLLSGSWRRRRKGPVSPGS